MRNLLISFLVFNSCIYLQAQDRATKRNNRTFAIYPAFGYQPETSLQLGAVAVWVLQSEDESQSEYVRRSSFSPFFLYTLRNQALAEANLDYFFKNGININAAVRFFGFPDLYFGIGNDNQVDNKESYSNIYGQIAGRIYKAVKPRLLAGIAYDLHTTRIADVVEGGLLENDAVNGLSGGDIFGFGPSVRYDSRNNVIYPSDGYFLLFETTFNRLGDFNFNSYTTDLRRYFALGSDKNIIAIQLNGRFSSGSDIPFFKLPQLGGSEWLRGIANASLYRDRQAVYTQVEYRRYLIWGMGLTAFGGMGDVAPSVASFDLSEFKYIAGLGFRYAVIPSQKLNLRFDFGVSSRGHTAFYLSMREAF